MKITLSCQFCDQEEEVEIVTMHSVRYGEIYQDSFCEKHRAVEAFFSEQCPGCVSGWGECRFFDKLDLGLSEEDKVAVLSGRCPERINGTLVVENGHMEDVDLSSPSIKEDGKAVVQAFADYRDIYIQGGPS